MLIYIYILSSMCRIVRWILVLGVSSQQVHAKQMVSCFFVFVQGVLHALHIDANLLSCHHCGSYLCYILKGCLESYAESV